MLRRPLALATKVLKMKLNGTGVPAPPAMPLNQGSWLGRPDQPSITKNLPMHGSPSLVVVSVSGSVTSEDEPLLPNAMRVPTAGRVGVSLRRSARAHRRRAVLIPRSLPISQYSNVHSKSPKPALT